MDTVSAYDAKTHFSALLGRAAAGESIVITKHGHPVARLIPADLSLSADDVAERLLELRSGNRLQGDSPRDLIEDGRRH
jgi:prevent-host-death family protein